jgi:CubicO group peptidase (beta-lactamase class C family)
MKSNFFLNTDKLNINTEFNYKLMHNIRLKNRTIIMFALLFLILLSCRKSTDMPLQPLKTNNPLLTDFDKRINDIVAPYAQKSSTAGLSIGIFKDNKVYYYGYGETKKGNNIIPDSTTLYELGSITKTFTALLIIDYLQSNSLSINCPINDLLPSDIPLLQINNKPILIKHILNHTSGLPRVPDDFLTGNDQKNPYKRYDSTMFYNYLKTFRLQREPGQTLEYSNLGLALMGVILERKLHKSYQEILLEEICNPMGLNHTGIIVSENDALKYADGHDSEGNFVEHWNDLNAFNGAGAIKSNVKDLLIYGKNILFSESSCLKTPIDISLNVTFESGSEKIGSGWEYINLDGVELFGHEGTTAGFYSCLRISRSKNIVFVLLTNNGLGSADLSNCISKLLVELIK